MTVVTNPAATGINLGGGSTVNGITINTSGVLVNPNDSSAIASSRLAGRPVPRGKRVLLWGGSETARGFTTRLASSPGQVTFNAATQTITVNVIHKLHDGALVFLASETATAPQLNTPVGTITVDNGFSYGPITVVDSTHYTLPYWSALPAGSPYLSLNGTNTISLTTHRLQCLSANSKLQELNRWLGDPLQFVMSIATGSNNTSHMVERLPALITMAQQGLFDELRGTGGIGNTLLFFNNAGKSIAQAVAQVEADLLTFLQALAPYGIVMTLEVPPTQTGTTGATTAGTLQTIDMLRQLAKDPAYRLNLEDEFTYSVDPSTGTVRTRYQLNGNNPTHPSREGCVYYSSEHFEGETIGGNHYPNTTRLVESPLDCYLADATSLQFIDALTSTTPTILASTVDASSKSTGSVPNIVRAITSTGNAGRAMAWSYEQNAEYWHIYCLLTAGAANDTFTLTIANLVGQTRSLETVFLSNPGATFFVGCDFSFLPASGSWTSIETFMTSTMTYGAVTANAGYNAADSSNDSANTDGPMTQPFFAHCRMPLFTVPPTTTAVASAGLTFVATAASAGTAILRISKPTCRLITPF